jgi:hypothetical protein
LAIIPRMLSSARASGAACSTLAVARLRRERTRSSGYVVHTDVIPACARVSSYVAEWGEEGAYERAGRESSGRVERVPVRGEHLRAHMSHS